MQQRRDEILAKKAKLAELKRQRELRATQNGPGRPSFSGSDVRNQPVPSPSPLNQTSADFRPILLTSNTVDLPGACPS